LHIVHLATPEPLPALRAARREGLRITVETCPHYLSFCAEQIGDGRTEFKCAPPIRERIHQEGLWLALLAGDLDLVTTDHSPAPPALKHLDDGDFTMAWGGIASLQLGLGAVWTEAARRGVSLDRASRWLSGAPAALAGLAATKGTIAVEHDADLVIFDPDIEASVDARRLEHRHPVTPYHGMRLRGVVHKTLLRGRVIYDDGRVVGEPRGRPILARTATISLS
ncbi:MAG: amidohydrolase family protein, partial [Acidobacteria bacterium]|nr:amidohydrolase family protein [Acidobacteriota bacterium]